MTGYNPQTPAMSGRERARQAVRQELARRGWSRMDLVDASGASVDAVTDFLKENEPTWPRAGTLAKVETALGWPAGRLTSMARNGAGEGELPPGVTIDLLIDPEVWEDMTPAAQQEARAAAQVAILAKLRELGVL